MSANQYDHHKNQLHQIPGATERHLTAWPRALELFYRGPDTRLHSMLSAEEIEDSVTTRIRELELQLEQANRSNQQLGQAPAQPTVAGVLVY